MIGGRSNALRSAIAERSARVGVVGLGYVGLPLTVEIAAAGFPVTGIDKDDAKRNTLRSGRSYINDVADDTIASMIGGGHFAIASSLADAGDLDIVVICVETPLSGGMPDLSRVLEVADDIAASLLQISLVVLESTTFPGTTEEVLRPRLEGAALRAGHDFALAFSPERIDPGNKRAAFSLIPKVVAGVTPNCAALAEHFYSTFCDKVVVVGRPREAEMAKLLENTYRQVNIALANEFAMIAHELDIDIWEVIDAASSKPFGFEPFYPGVGIGGHCIAVDPVFLTWRIRELGRAPFRLSELAREIDDAMPRYVAGRIVDALRGHGIPIRGASVLCLGVTYKKDVADLRASRPIDVIAELERSEVKVSYHDPFHDSIQVGDSAKAVTPLDQGLDDADLTAILTDHSDYDVRSIVERSTLVFDARGVTRGIRDPKITRL